MLGCGMLTWGAAGVVAKAVNLGDANLDVTIHNLGVWLSALFNFTSVLLLLRPSELCTPGNCGWARRTPAPWAC